MSANRSPKNQKLAKFSKRTISIIMSLVMVITALPLAGLRVAAATIVDLRDALTAPESGDFSVAYDMRGFVNTYSDSPETGLTNWTNYTDVSAADGSWLVLNGNQTVWDALYSYADVAQSYQGSGPSGFTLNGDAVQGEEHPDAWTDGANYTAQQINDFIVDIIDDGDPEGLLPLFSGGFEVYSGGPLTDDYGLLDQPRVAHYDAGADEWEGGWMQSYGSVAVLRSPLEAVKATVSSLPASGSVTAPTALELYYNHKVENSGTWTDSAGDENISMWHELDALVRQEGPVVVNPGVLPGQEEVTLSAGAIAALNAWKAATKMPDGREYTAYTENDWKEMTLGQLQGRLDALDAAGTLMSGSSFPTEVGNGGVWPDLLDADNKPLLDHFGLRDFVWAEGSTDLIDGDPAHTDDYRGWLTKYLDAHEYEADFFYNGSDGVLESGSEWNIFASSPFSGVSDPRGGTLNNFMNDIGIIPPDSTDPDAIADLVEELFAKYQMGRDAIEEYHRIYNLGTPAEWSNLITAHPELDRYGDGADINTDDQEDWVNAVGHLIYLLLAWEIKDYIDDLDTMIENGDLHEGVNPNDPFDSDYPDPDHYGDSVYVIETPQLYVWHAQVLAYQNVLSKFDDWGSGYGYIETGLGLVTDLPNVLTKLEEELGYREDWDLYFGGPLDLSEKSWYGYRDFFTEVKATPYPATTNAQVAQIFALFHNAEQQVESIEIIDPEDPDSWIITYIPDLYVGAKANQQKYIEKMTAASADPVMSVNNYNGNTWFEEIYRGYEQNVVQPAMEHLLTAPALKLSGQVEAAMAIMRASAASLPPLNLTYMYPYDDIRGLSASTISDLEAAINAIDVALHDNLAGAFWSGYDYGSGVPYYDGLRQMIPVSGSDFFVENLDNNLTTEMFAYYTDMIDTNPDYDSPTYIATDAWKIVEVNYWWLRTRVLDAIEHYKNSAYLFYERIVLIPPYRGPMTNDILFHRYADVGVSTTDRLDMDPARQDAFFATTLPYSANYPHNPWPQGYGWMPRPLDSKTPAPNGTATSVYSGYEAFPTSGTLGSPRYDTRDDAAMNDLIDKLDFVLGAGGNFRPLLKMVGVDEMLAGLGIKFGDTANLNFLVQSLLGNVVYTDSIINMLFGLIYPMITNLMEVTVFDEMIMDAFMGIKDTPVVGGMIPNIIHLYRVLDTTDSIGNLQIYPRLIAGGMLGSGSNSIFPRVYAVLNAQSYMNGFSGVHTGMSAGNPGIPYNNAINPDTSAPYGRVHYPTGAWAIENQNTANPMYIPERDDNGAPTSDYVFALPWYIDRLGPGEAGYSAFADPYNYSGTYNPVYDFKSDLYDPVAREAASIPDQERTTAQKEARFREALTELIRGLFPALNAVLLGNGLEIEHRSLFQSGFLGSLQGVVKITFDDKVHGFAQILTPIFECLFGESAQTETTLLSDAALKAIGSGLGANPNDATIRARTTQLVNAIFNPLLKYIMNLSERPITEILNLLPNLCYAIDQNRIQELLQGIVLRLGVDLSLRHTITIWPGIPVGYVTAALVTLLLQGILWIAGDPLNIPPLNVSDMLEGLVPGGLDAFLDRENLWNMVFGEDGFVGAYLPLYPIDRSRISSFGEFLSTGNTTPTDTQKVRDGTSLDLLRTKRYKPGGGLPVRNYIRADKPDLLQWLLGTVLGKLDDILALLDVDLDTILPAGITLFPPVSDNYEVNAAAQIAAIAELVMPRKYPVPPVAYKYPADLDFDRTELYPPWWAGLHPGGAGKAELDANYLLDNIDVLLNALWGLLHPGESLKAGIDDLIQPLFNGEMMTGLTEMLQGLVVSLLDMELFEGFDLLGLVQMLVRIDNKQLSLADMFDCPLGLDASGLSTRPVLINDPTPAQEEQHQEDLADWMTSSSDTAVLLTRPLASYYAAAAGDTPEGLLHKYYPNRTFKEDLEDYLEAVANYYNGRVNSVEDFFGETINLLGSVSLIFDFLLNDMALELVNIGDDTGIVKVLGGEGFEKGLKHLVGAIAWPLGIETDMSALVAPAAGDTWPDDGTPKYPLGASDPAFTRAETAYAWATSGNSLGQILYPLVEALNLLMHSPIKTLLKVLPNLVYYLTEPKDSGGAVIGDSPLQQSANNLLYPLYVLLDTLRPIVDVSGFLAPLLSGLGLDQYGVAIQLGGNYEGGEVPPISLDLDALLGNLLGDFSLEIGGAEITLDLATFRKFLQGTLTNTGHKFPPAPNTETIPDPFTGNPTKLDEWYVRADSDMAGLLFLLLDILGMSDIILEMGMVGVTKLIQYGDPKKDPNSNWMPGLNYRVAAGLETKNLPWKDFSVGNTTLWYYDVDDAVPSWWRPSHSQFLVDNVDLLLGWLWREIVFDVPAVKTLVEDLLNDLLGGGVTLYDNLQDTIGTIWNTGFLKENLLMLMNLVLSLDDMLEGFGDLKVLLGGFLGTDAEADAKRAELMAVVEEKERLLNVAKGAFKVQAAIYDPLQQAFLEAKAELNLPANIGITAFEDAANNAKEARDAVRDDYIAARNARDQAQKAYDDALAEYNKELPLLDGLLGGLLGDEFSTEELLGATPLYIKDILKKLIVIYDEATNTKIPLDLDVMLTPIKDLYEDDAKYQEIIAECATTGTVCPVDPGHDKLRNPAGDCVDCGAPICTVHGATTLCPAGCTEPLVCPVDPAHNMSTSPAGDCVDCPLPVCEDHGVPRELCNYKLALEDEFMTAFEAENMAGFKAEKKDAYLAQELENWLALPGNEDATQAQINIFLAGIDGDADIEADNLWNDYITSPAFEGLVAAYVAANLPAIDELKSKARALDAVRDSVLAGGNVLADVTDQSSFEAALAELLHGFMPVLAVFLGGRNILLIEDSTVQPNNQAGVPGGPHQAHVTAATYCSNVYALVCPDNSAHTDPTNHSAGAECEWCNPAACPVHGGPGWDNCPPICASDCDIPISPPDDKALLRVYGNTGYQTGLLPLLAGIGADVPGFVDVLVSPEEFNGSALATGTESADLDAAKLALAAAKKDIADYNALVAELAEIQTKLSNLNSDLIQAQLELVEAESADLEDEVAALEAKIAALEGEIATLGARADELDGAGGLIDLAEGPKDTAVTNLPGLEDDVAAAQQALNDAIGGSLGNWPMTDNPTGQQALNEAQLMAIFNPIMFLLNALADNPVQTLLQVLPNLFYFISDEIEIADQSIYDQTKADFKAAEEDLAEAKKLVADLAALEEELDEVLADIPTAVEPKLTELEARRDELNDPGGLIDVAQGAVDNMVSELDVADADEALEILKGFVADARVAYLAAARANKSLIMQALDNILFPLTTLLAMFEPAGGTGVTQEPKPADYGYPNASPQMPNINDAAYAVYRGGEPTKPTVAPYSLTSAPDPDNYIYVSAYNTDQDAYDNAVAYWEENDNTHLNELNALNTYNTVTLPAYKANKKLYTDDVAAYRNALRDWMKNDTDGIDFERELEAYYYNKGFLGDMGITTLIDDMIDSLLGDNRGLGDLLNGILDTTVADLLKDISPLLTSFHIEDLIVGKIQPFSAMLNYPAGHHPSAPVSAGTALPAGSDWDVRQLWLDAMDINYNSATDPYSAEYVEVDMPLLLTQLLLVTNLFGLIDDYGFQGLIELLNVWDREHLADPEPLDYANAPIPATVNIDETMLTKEVVEFILENADEIVNWAWYNLIYLEPMNTWLTELLNDPEDGLLKGIDSVTFEIFPTLEETIANLLDMSVFTQDTLSFLVAMVADLELEEMLSGLLEGIEINGVPLDLPLTEIIDKLVMFDDDTPLNLSGALKIFKGYANWVEAEETTVAELEAQLATVGIDPLEAADIAPKLIITDGDQDEFVVALEALLAPVLPLLSFLLTGSKIKLIIGADTAGSGEWSLGKDLDLVWVDEFGGAEFDEPYGGFLVIDGGKGYNYGLLPLLMALVSDLEIVADGTLGIDSLLPPIDYDTDLPLDDGELLGAIVNPIVFLLKVVAERPIDTVLRLLPNLAYFFLPGGSEPSLLEQALNNLLSPLSTLVEILAKVEFAKLGLGEFDLTKLGGLALVDDQGKPILGKAICEMLLSLLDMDLGGLNVLALLGKLIVGTIEQFDDPFYTVGVYGDTSDMASYVKVDKVLLIFQLVTVLTADDGILPLDQGTKELINAITRLILNGAWRNDPAPDKIDYKKSPEPVEVDYDAAGLKPEMVQFLMDNVDEVLNWAWYAMFAGNTEGKLWLEDLIGIDDFVRDTIPETLDALLGNFLYTRSNLDLIVDLVAGLLGDLVDSHILGDDIPLTLNDIISRAFVIIDNGTTTPLNLNELLKGFFGYAGGKEFTGATAEKDFMDEVKALLLPLVPVLRLLLTDGDLLGIVNDDYTTITPNGSFIKLKGANGYETGLLPLFMGIGAGIPGFLETLKPYSAIVNNDAALLDAIINPIMFLLNALINDPINTILTVLPNLAYMILPGNVDAVIETQAAVKAAQAAVDAAQAARDALPEGDPGIPAAQEALNAAKEALLKAQAALVNPNESILSQALVNLLFPVTSLLREPAVTSFLVGLLGDIVPAGFNGAALASSLNELLIGLVTGLGDIDIGLAGMKPIVILEVLRALVVGELVPFSDKYLLSLGVFGSLANGARFLDVNLGGLLVSLLTVLGAFDLLKIELGDEVLDLIGLLELLNYPGRERVMSLSPIIYPIPAFNTGIYYSWTWSRRDAVAMLDKLPGLLDELLEMILGAKLNDYLAGLLGTSLFNKGNFESIVGMLQDLLAGLDLDGMKIIDGRTLGQLLRTPTECKVHGKMIDCTCPADSENLVRGVLMIGGEPIDVLDILDQLANFTYNEADVDGKDGFIKEIIRFLAPVTPLLDFLLFSKDITLLGIPVVNGGSETGLLVVHGQEGYAYGLVPLLEALLMPLGLEGEITDADALRNLEGEAKLRAILMPLLDAVDTVIANPLNGLLQLLPTLVYFITATGEAKDGQVAMTSPLEQSLDRILYAVTSLLSLLIGKPADIWTVLSMLGVDFELDIPGLLDGLIFDLLGVPNLGSTLLKVLLVGSSIDYTCPSSGGAALFLSLLTPENQADLLTVLLRTVIELIQGDKETRELIVTMLGDMILSQDQFGGKALHWGIHFILWVFRVLGTEITLESLQRLINWLSWLMPIIRWVLKLFGVLG